MPARKHQKNISVAVRRLAGDGGAGGRARRRGGRTSTRDEGIGARVLRLEVPTPAFFAFSDLPTPAAQGGDPEKFKELAWEATAKNNPPGKMPCREGGQVQMMVLPASPRDGVSDA